MSRRLHPTLADYLVIAVSPALIMALVGSLIFFLLDIFYQGSFVGRLHFVFACFIMAAVLIGRISIEMGSAHAMSYAAPLAIVTVLALGKFVEYPSGVAESYSLIVNVGLVALMMWCANKLTWDCTFIDESREESGEGVLRTMGLDQPPSPPAPLPQAGEGSHRAASKKPRPHSGGVWVVYFSLAALPLFGLGQRFLPAENLDRRRYAFLLLCVYVASGLGLLLTTSFLGLRRYLRGRRLQMPVTVAGAWVMIGCLLIAAILGFAVLLPRPSPEYAISEIPWQISSAKRAASRQAVGREGTQDTRKDAPGGEDHRRPQAKKTPDQAPETSKAAEGEKTSQTGNDRSQGNRAGDHAASKSSEAKAPKGAGNQQESSGQETSQSGQRRDGKSGDSKGEGKDSKGGSQDQAKGSSRADQEGSQDQAKGGSPADRKGSQDRGKGGSSAERNASQDRSKGRSSVEQKGPQDQRAESQGSAKSQDAGKASPPPPQTPQPAPQPSSPLPSLSLPLAGTLKWLFYLAVIAGVAYGAWRSRAALAQALKDFLEAWRAFWASLFGGKQGPKEAAGEEAAGEVKPAPRPFADYADPFAAGWAERWSPDELVRYSFAALEAWGREHGCPRGPEQTPYEFAENVGDRAKHLGRLCRKMADLYSRAAYAPGTLPATSVAPLRDFWQQLTSG